MGPGAFAEDPFPLLLVRLTMGRVRHRHVGRESLLELFQFLPRPPLEVVRQGVDVDHAWADVLEDAEPLDLVGPALAAGGDLAGLGVRVVGGPAVGAEQELP